MSWSLSRYLCNDHALCANQIKIYHFSHHFPLLKRWIDICLFIAKRLLSNITRSCCNSCCPHWNVSSKERNELWIKKYALQSLDDLEQHIVLLLPSTWYSMYVCCHLIHNLLKTLLAITYQPLNETIHCEQDRQTDVRINSRRCRSRLGQCCLVGRTAIVLVAEDVHSVFVSFCTSMFVIETESYRFSAASAQT